MQEDFCLNTLTVICYNKDIKTILQGGIFIMKKVFKKITVFLCTVMLFTAISSHSMLNVSAAEPETATTAVVAPPAINPAAPNMGITLEQVLAYNKVSNILWFCTDVYLSTSIVYVGPDNPDAGLQSGSPFRNEKMHFTRKDGFLHAEYYDAASCETVTKVAGRPGGGYVVMRDKDTTSFPFPVSFIGFPDSCYDQVTMETFQPWGTSTAQFNETLASVTTENGLIVVRSASGNGFAHTYCLDPQTMLIISYECHNNTFQESVAISYNVPPADGFQMPFDPVSTITGSQDNCLVTAVLLPGTPQQEVQQYTVPKNCLTVYAFSSANFFTTFSDPECKNWIIPNTGGESTAFYVAEGGPEDAVAQIFNTLLSSLQ